MAKYHKPERRVHRGFYYLDDETVINSLSAVEAGKVDEVVSKVNSAREGGLSGGVGLYGAKVEGGRKATSEFEEEIVRTRTRFSIFELWYENLRTSKALGTFEGWSEDILSEVRPGDTVEMRANLALASLQTMFRLFLWFAKQAQTQGTPFSLKGDELKALKEQVRILTWFIRADEPLETVAIATVLGGDGPVVGMQLADKWMIGALGRLSGQYTIVGQVDHVLTAGQEFPALRLTDSAPVTPLELSTLKEIIPPFVAPSKAFGINVSENDAAIKGPALWLTPIAIFR